MVSDATEENIDPNILREDDFSIKIQNMSSNKDVSPSTSARSINIETPSTSKDCLYRVLTSDEKSSSICNSPSESRQMSLVTSHVTAPPTTSSSYRSSNI